MIVLSNKVRGVHLMFLLTQKLKGSSEVSLSMIFTFFTVPLTQLILHRYVTCAFSLCRHIFLTRSVLPGLNMLTYHKRIYVSTNDTALR